MCTGFPELGVMSLPQSFGQYLASDLREVTDRGIGHVMELFRQSFVVEGAVQAEAPPNRRSSAGGGSGGRCRARGRVRRALERSPPPRGMSDAPVEVRPAAPGDHDEIIGVASRALGWAADERDRAFFRWKHGDNPFGPSPAGSRRRRAGGRLPHLPAGGSSGGEHLRWSGPSTPPPTPTFRGGGCSGASPSIGRRPLRARVDAVFNTPNDRSRPG